MTQVQPCPPECGQGHPAAMDRLVAALEAAGWEHAHAWGADTADHRYVHLEARPPDHTERVMVTWHSRATGGRTLRLFTCMIKQPYKGWRARSLVKIHEHLETDHIPGL